MKPPCACILITVSYSTRLSGFICQQAVYKLIREGASVWFSLNIFTSDALQFFWYFVEAVNIITYRIQSVELTTTGILVRHNYNWHIDLVNNKRSMYHFLVVMIETESKSHCYNSWWTLKIVRHNTHNALWQITVWPGVLNILRCWLNPVTIRIRAEKQLSKL